MTMRFVKIYDTDKVQCYFVENPSKEYEKAFPKTFTYAFRNEKGITFNENSDRINNFVKIFNANAGYVFTTKRVDFKKIFTNNKQNQDDELINALPTGSLNIYLKKGKEVVLHISPKQDKILPCCFLKSVFIQHMIKDLIDLNQEDFKKLLRKEICEELKLDKTDMIKWVSQLITEIPTTASDTSIRFPNKITDKNINNTDFRLSDLLLLYYIVPNTVFDELKLVSLFELSFCNLNRKVYLYNGINNLVVNIIPELEKKGIKYSLYEVPERDIVLMEIRYKDLLELKQNYYITDYFC